MKTIKYIFSCCLIALTIWACSDDEKNANYSLTADAPSELDLSFNVTQDNSGLVTITPTAVGAMLFDIDFGDGSDSEEIENGSKSTHTYAEGVYTVALTAFGATGIEASITKELVVSFQPPVITLITIQNSESVSKQVDVYVEADNAATVEVHFGETADADPVVGNIGEVVSGVYENPGIYTITVEVKGAAIETVVYTEADFEVTEIVAPTTAAPSPFLPEANVISIYSDAYTNVTLNEVNPNWAQTTQLTEVQVEGNNTWFYSNLNYTGIVTDYGNPTDLSSKEYVHFDYWTPDANALGFKIVNTSYATGDPLKEDIETVGDVVQGRWVSVDIPLEDYTTDLSGVTQFLFDTMGSGAAIVYIDNIYFWTESFDSGLLQNGDFESGSTFWLVGVSDSSSAPVVVEADGNTHYSANVTSAGNAYDVNTSQKVEIVQGSTYTLTFDAWASVDRSIVAGIGLSAAPWNNTGETVNITTTRTTYTLTHTATDFGAVDARVLFDVGAEVGTVNIDNVALFLN